VAGATSFPAGPRGGGLACGPTAFGGHSGFICVLEDKKIMLVVMYVDTVPSASNVAVETLKVRSAIET
jgi:hypothetical protein